MPSPLQSLVLLLTFGVSTGVTTALLRWRTSAARQLRRVLRRRFPNASLQTDRESWRLTRGARTVRVPVRRVLAALERGEERFDAELAHALAETERAFRRSPALGDDEDAAAALEATLVPILLPLDRAEVLGPGARYTIPLGEGVEIGFVVDEPASDRWLTVGDREAVADDDDTLLAGALRNLRRRSDGVAVVREDLPGREVYVIRHGDGLDGSRLLLHDLWSDIAELAGDDLLLSAPTRDRVYAAPARQPGSIDRMVRHVSEDWVYRPHGVSPRIWTYSGDRLVPWTTHS